MRVLSADLNRDPHQIVQEGICCSRQGTLSSIATCQHGAVKKRPWLRLLIEDVFGFFQNLVLLPCLGHLVVLHQIAFALIFPILLPYLIIAEVIHIILSCLTCGYYRGFWKFSLDLSQPSEAEVKMLKELTGRHSSCTQEQLLDLAHIISRYHDFACAQTDPERDEIVSGKFQAIMRVEIDGQAQLFQFTPRDEKKELLKEYLSFISTHLKAHSQVHHQFVGLNYCYIIGLLKMQIQSDRVSYDCGKGDSQKTSLLGKKIRLFAPKIGSHTVGEAECFNFFSLWPRFTRDAICQKINQQFSCQLISGDYISLMDLERLFEG